MAPTTEAAIIAAADVATDHRLGIWDSVMVAVAAEAGCRLLLSEDLQDRFFLARRYRGQSVRRDASSTSGRFVGR